MEDCARQRACDAIMKDVDIDADTLRELRTAGKNPNQWSAQHSNNGYSDAMLLQT